MEGVRACGRLHRRSRPSTGSSKWQQHIGDRRGTRPAIVLGRDAHGDAPVHPASSRSRRAARVRRLTWLGSDLCDYNAPLLAHDFSAAASSATSPRCGATSLRLLQRDPRFRFDFVDLQKMPETVGAQRNPFLDIQGARNPSGAYVATLGGDWDEFYAAKRSSATRKTERRQLKHLAEHGDVRFVDVEEHAEIARTLETLISQKSQRLRPHGRRGPVRAAGLSRVLSRYRDRRNVRALTHVSRLDVGATIAATNLGLTLPRLLLSRAVELPRRRDLALRPRPRASARAAAPRDRARLSRDFDFTIGDEPYKRDWSDIEVRLYDHLAAATLRGAVVVAMIDAPTGAPSASSSRRPCSGRPTAKPAKSPGSCAFAEPRPRHL